MFFRLLRSIFLFSLNESTLHSLFSFPPGLQGVAPGLCTLVCYPTNIYKCMQVLQALHLKCLFTYHNIDWQHYLLEAFSKHVLWSCGVRLGKMYTDNRSIVSNLTCTIAHMTGFAAVYMVNLELWFSMLIQQNDDL